MNEIDRMGNAKSKVDVSHFLVTKIRPLVLQKLEVLRAEKKIGKALEASVIWEIPDLDFATMILCGWLPRQLEELFGISRVEIYATDGDERLDAYPLI